MNSGIYKPRNLSPDNSTGMVLAGGAASGAALGTQIAPGYGTAIGAGLGALYGIWQSSQAKKRAADLEKEKKAHFSEDPTVAAERAKAAQESTYGFNPQQNAVFLNNLARARTLRQHNATEMAGGSLGQAVNAQNTAYELNALNQHAGQDAVLQQQKHAAYVNEFVNQLQGLRNMQTRHDQQYRLLREQAIGQGGAAGGYNTITNLQSGIGAGVDIYARAKGLPGQPNGMGTNTTGTLYPWQMPDTPAGSYPPQPDQSNQNYDDSYNYLPRLKGLSQPSMYQQ